MKLVKKIFVVMMIISIAACKSDDDGNPNADADGDGVIDSEDLCPNEPGTLIDSGCYYVTEVNLAGTHQIAFIESTRTETYDLSGVEVVATITNVGSVLQVELKFNVNGTYTLIGEYLNTKTTVVPGVDAEIVEEIIILNESGDFETNNDDLEISLINGFNGEIEIFSVALFNQNELNVTFENSGTIDTNGTFEYIQEIRLIR